MNSTGLKLAQYNPCPSENTRACARAADLAKRPMLNQITDEEPLATIQCLTDNCTEVPRFLFLLQIDPGLRRAHRPSPCCSDRPRSAVAAQINYWASIMDPR